MYMKCIFYCIYDRFIKIVLIINKIGVFLFDVEMLINNKIIINI